ncbi:UNVERIFIED_CONTAM: hypothetical protein GTU68_019778 [Idotea baltica]|nr:hypothetical protein [Idotea baltica]
MIRFTPELPLMWIAASLNMNHKDQNQRSISGGACR